MATSEADPTPSGSAMRNELPITVPVRRDSSSSYGSDLYSPLPPGRWLVDFHGNCSRCHHHHSSVRVKVNVSDDPDTVSHVRCEGCQQKWLAIGGRNATQISLLSVNSTSPDPVEADVRCTLISMVRSTTTITPMSPVLTGIPEGSPIWSQSRRQPGQLVGEGATEPGPQHEGNGAAPHLPFDHVGSARSQPEGAFRPVRSQAKNATSTQKHTLATVINFANLRKRLGAHLHTLHHPKVTLGISRQPKISARSLGKRPVQEVVAPMSEPSQAPEMGTLGPAEDGPSAGVGPRAAGSPESDLHSPPVTASQFKDDLAKERPYLQSLPTERDRVAWLRAKYTVFKSRPSRPTTTPVSTPTALSTVLPGTIQRLQQPNSPHPTRYSTDLVGIGSHSGLFDRFWPDNPAPGSSTLIISDRTSEAETAIDHLASGLVPPPSVLRTERRGSGSPRPLSPPGTPRTVQQLRQSRPETRFSMDSTVIGDTPSLSRTRSPAADRNSQGSALRNSVLSATRLSMSQASSVSR